MGGQSSKTVPLTEEDLKCVQDYWKVIMENPEDNGVVIFKTFLTRHNYYSYFKKFSDIPIEELENHPTFRNHALSIIRAIDKVVQNLENEEAVKTELIALGKMHAKRKITENQFQELKAVILDILESAFNLPSEALDAWRKTLDYAFVYIFEGLAEQ